MYRIAGIYHEAFNFANFAIWDALAKIKASTQCHTFLDPYIFLVWIYITLYGIQKSQIFKIV